MEISEGIRRERERAGMSTRALAAAAGVVQSTVVGIEGGKKPHASTLKKIADALGTDVETLQGGENPERVRAEKRAAKVAAEALSRVSAYTYDEAHEEITLGMVRDR